MKGAVTAKRIVKTTSLKKSRLLHTSLNQENNYDIDLISLRRVKRVKTPEQQPPSSSKDKTSDSIINVSRPIPVNNFKEPVSSASQAKLGSGGTISTYIKDINADITQLESSISQTFGQLEDVLHLVSKQNSSNTQLIQDLKNRVREVEAEKKKDAQELSGLQDEKRSIQIKVKELERFLQDAQSAKKQEDEEHFREVRAFETSLSKSRTLNQRNFFSPIDAKLLRRVRRGNYPALENKDNLLFPVIPSSDDRIHEFMILNKKRTIITNENPLGSGYHKPDLLSLMKNLGPDSNNKYWDIILKHEKSHWNLIATEGYSNEKILIFERYVTPKDLKKLERQKYLKFGYALSTVGLIGAGISHFFYIMGTTAGL